VQAIPDILCYLNGELLPLSQAKVSVLDRGFIFGDGIYEAIPVYGRRLFRFDEHMARLTRSLGKVRIENPHTRAEWLERARKLIAALPTDDQLLYLQITRGVAWRDHVMPPDIEPTVFMMASPMKPPPPEQRHQGVACITAWPASAPATSVGSAATSSAPRCWAT
jgi:D-alanine transaminase